MHSLNLRATFNTAADRYHAMRPRYPAELFDRLITQTQLHSTAQLLEIGPGTGQATAALAARGYTITAVELGDQLAQKARHVLADYPNVTVITGAFEDVALSAAQYDLVYSATAFHWIKPEYKFVKPHTLLKPGGHLAIIHTEHVSDDAGDAFLRASWPIYRKYDNADAPADISRFSLPRLDGLKPPHIDTTLFTLDDFAVFPMTIRYSSQEYIDLLATYSPHLALPETARQQFFQEIQSLIDSDFGGFLTKHYGMTLAIAQKRAGGKT